MSSNVYLFQHFSSDNSTIMRKNISILSLPAILTIIFFSLNNNFPRKKSAQLTSDFHFEQITWSPRLQTCETRAFIHSFLSRSSHDLLTIDQFSSLCSRDCENFLHFHLKSRTKKSVILSKKFIKAGKKGESWLKIDKKVKLNVKLYRRRWFKVENRS